MGLYRNAFSDSEIVELNNRLVMFDPSGPNPTQQTRLIRGFLNRIRPARENHDA